MKCRSGFVSNSSSASFIVRKDGLTEDQCNAIRFHIDYAIANRIPCGKNGEIVRTNSARWQILESDTDFRGETAMDNFLMDILFTAIGLTEDQYRIDSDELF
jgi:hypothetical protein